MPVPATERWCRRLNKGRKICALVISGRDPDAVVAHFHHTVRSHRFGGYFNPHRLRATVLDGIAQQILHQSGQLALFTFTKNARQRGRRVMLAPLS